MKQAYLNAGVMDRLNSRTIDSPDSDGSLEADSYYDEDFLLGTGLDMGLMFEIADAWKLQLELTGSHGVAGDDHAYAKGFLQQRWRLGQQSDVRYYVAFLAKDGYNFQMLSKFRSIYRPNLLAYLSNLPGTDP
ncbi:MAG: hypothetical protein HN580_18615 [Deltaproteobacteria bacterium]|nr:hypothetical protein [Deltaproteobacteria bacterium]MBT4264702.1 hypothetical protein [Deltaproteobacteria bacterium]MBT4637564.1 hypothetical protein [Deltaproteobacteria bacterium]MBT6501633.1 hypothetical protein [Deltaproteobacteria bacterium]MBT6614312.1 hypothetical protein [Deltaproteobacteria bacterium]